MYIPQQIPAPLPASTTQSVQRPLALGCATVLGLAEQTWPLNELFRAAARAYHITAASTG